ncbi:MAG: hypothetical protein HYT87_01855 [Nitrospirae bacterium]|nr:hypothetical protein [Nitrospirota bacterium]
MRKLTSRLGLILFTAFLLGIGCAEKEKTGGLAPSKGAVIVTTDFGGSGTVASLSLGPDPALWSLSDKLELVSSDPTVRVFGSRVYVINRFGADNIQLLDPNNNYLTAGQYSIGKGANPHDILELSATKAYVTRFEPPYDDILIVNPTTGDELGTISLKGVSGLNKTSTPRPHQMIKVDDRVYVILQNLDSAFSETGNSLLAVIDPASDALIDADPATPEIDTIDLGLKNASGNALYKDEVFIAGAGDYLAQNPAAEAGVVAVNVKTHAVRTIIGGAALSGRPGEDLAVTESGRGYLAVTDSAYPATFKPSLLEFDAATGSLGAAIYTGSSTASALQSFELDSRGHLLILDRDPANPGVVVVDTKTRATIGDRFPTSIPPAAIAIVSEE